MAINCDTHDFKIPQKEVKAHNELKKWAESEAYQDIMGMLLAVNTAVRGLKMPPATAEAGSDAVRRLVALLDHMSSWVDEIAPVEQPQRFGNKAFRTFYQRLEERAEPLLRDALPPKLHRAVPEMAVYLTESVGNATRIDYGTGHELAFVMLLCCLFKVGALAEDDMADAGLVVFPRYLRLAQQLQQRYRMEPAGSQGVWSLDDHQFVPFIWGSAQLIDQNRVSPKAIANEDMVHALAKDYLIFAAIEYILKVKTGPFAEHSNQLWNISAVARWTKVNSGLLNMYRGEVLCKFPVIQHCRFGSILSIAPASERIHELVIPADVTGGPLGGLGMHTGMPVGRMPPAGAMPGKAPMGRMPPPGGMPMGRMPPPGEVPMGRMPGTVPMGRMPPSAGKMPPPPGPAAAPGSSAPAPGQGAAPSVTSDAGER
ncbi:serine/threonine-protein phosphatase 2A activator-like [Amphibalanus amphitrite]|uniref:serine/threonine-protein phosphatase 2A activator-like n=1 Tax=Amphibalanus amphitrite TaxID=1232801 RepID=UPI001C9151B8|nr:serine/threonine-protein phosphatase 2A activator-like [Amphibalanus amphitrite]XP_043210447.1 serine/threonine-protein phosphatase 2A activator-like [Amphibalanus amphitrite]XP_043243876.1 serine/threonine-protein phosphatase 2A activator-like [Amphibalanus amphitrite]